ncbi:MAG TPA: carboxypeptidase M32 [Bellilinea sp.]|nr:carboxypeptidase M32 [Bellilinea sp.]
MAKYEKKLKKLKETMAEIIDLGTAEAVLGWDAQTYMPKKGSLGRSEQFGTLTKIVHEKATSKELAKLIDDLMPMAEKLGPDDDDAALVKLAYRKLEKNRKVPTEMAAEMARTHSLAQDAWVEAKNKSDFSIFKPHLQKNIEFARKYSALFAPFDHPYDPLLDDFEHGMKTVDVKAIFEPLRVDQVSLIKAIGKKKQVEHGFLDLKYEDKKQWDFGVDVITRMGYDWDAGRQDRAEHPFTTSFNVHDVRITTHIHENMMSSGLFSTVHEAGHALYEQGIDPKYFRTILCDGVSSAVHESQSRLWENIVARSKEFWVFFYPTLQKTFKKQLGDVSMEAFHKAINMVEPSFIRTESDEATYNLHIMLRFELELALLEGKLEVDQLPGVWNAKMEEYLGVKPTSDKVGVLQDVHWSSGYFGYFPTYALGNLVSAMLWEKILVDIPDLHEQIAKGEFSALLAWLRKNIHQYGSKYEPQKLIEMATGQKINAQPYLRYLKKKYSDIYGLKMK